MHASPNQMQKKTHIKKGDMVKVLAGEDRAKQGRVLDVDRSHDTALVEGLRINKKHSKPTKTSQQGGIIDRDMPVDASNVMLVHKGKTVRIGYQIKDDGTKVRIARPSGEVIG